MRRRSIGRAGRPSLIGTAARTAVIAGTATAVSGRVAAAQAQPAQPAQPATEAAPAPTVAPPEAPQAAGQSTSDILSELAQLGELRTAGVVTDAEFEQLKARLLGG